MSGKAEAGKTHLSGRSMEGKGRRRRRRSAKSYMAAFLSAVLLFTSVDYTQVQAAVLSGESLENLSEDPEKEPFFDESGEESGESPSTPESSESSENDTESTEDSESSETEPESPESSESSETEPESTEDSESSETDTEETDATEENTEELPEEEQTSQPSESTEVVEFVRTPEGAILITGFEPLPEEVAYLILEEKGTLEEAVSQMPDTLKARAYAYVYTEDSEEEEEQAEQEEEEEQAEAEEGGEQGTEAQEPVLRELEIPVSWRCSEDYENTELGQYVFQPKWDNSSYVYEAEEDAEELPTITVSFEEKKLTTEGAVATQEELEAALTAGVPEITLTADIPLTATMTVPASADIVLDGQGFSLYRGEDEDGVFTGTMLYLDGTGDAEDTDGSLTLTNICVDGQSKSTENHAGSSAIINYGSLFLDEGAVIKGNHNYGTYTQNEDEEKKAVVYAYGGGIQVYGKLTVMENASVTGNFADVFGGGVYLADGATLYLHADVIQDNTVTVDSGYGADLYAADGSTVYYNTSIDMMREGFHICEGAVLIGLDAPMMYADIPVDNNIEIYVNVSENSGYTREQVIELENKLEQMGYKVLSKRTDIDTTDLRNWYVYDHYEEAAWNALGRKWEQEYGGNYKRKYYAYIPSSNYYNNTVQNPVYTIADWLKRQDDYYNSTSNNMTLAQFKEHIYTRNEDRCPKMTFVGYGQPAYTDFLFYDPESDGEKVVSFDVDSSQVHTHTLEGSGFLVNTGIDESGNLYGYLVYYVYENKRITAETTTVTKTQATSLRIYKINGIKADELHQTATEAVRAGLLGTPIKEVSGFDWDDNMSIQIKATPGKIEVRQQPASETTDINKSSFVLECALSDGSKYSGFGPLVGYTTDNGKHTCSIASSFTYSNLRMYFTNPEFEQKDMLNPLEEADFTQQGTQKYFINLFGSAKLEYNTSPEFGQYQEYLNLMQN